MRRGWTFLVIVILAMSGTAPYASAQACCAADRTHACCQPTARILVDCCSSSADSSALTPEAQRSGVAPASAFTPVETAILAVENTLGVSGAIHRPPGLHAP